MAKYIRKGILEQFEQGNMSQYSLDTNTFDIELVEKDTEIETRSGVSLITAGNYIMTDSEGKKNGITPQDLEYQYERG